MDALELLQNIEGIFALYLVDSDGSNTQPYTDVSVMKIRLFILYETFHSYERCLYSFNMLHFLCRSVFFNFQSIFHNFIDFQDDSSWNQHPRGAARHESPSHMFPLFC